MKKEINYITLILIGSLLINSSCGDNNTENVETVNATATSTSTTNINTTIVGDTTLKNVIKEFVDLSQNIYEGVQKADSMHYAKKTRLWVYQIGDFYDNKDLVGNAYDKISDKGDNIYVFRKSKKKFYLIMGNGVATKKQLEDSIPSLERLFSERISIIDLSMVCRNEIKNTDALTYKIEKEKKEVDCKACE